NFFKPVFKLVKYSSPFMLHLILLSLCIASALTWLTLVFMPMRWRMSERWETADHLHVPISKWPSLSVIVPARNESTSLPMTLPSWLNQDYPNSEIILIDDESNDSTAERANDIAVRSNRIIRFLDGTTPPSGWTGKLWALQQGITASSGEWLLFTDADIRHCPNLWKGLVSKALTEKRAMVSLMALLDINGIWSRLLIPAFVYFFHVMYPFEKVRHPRSKISAAAGGCILISRHALNKIGGIEGYSNAWIDDLALAKRVKNAGLPLSLSLTKSVVSIRPYRQLCDVWNMVSRNAFSQLRCSLLILFVTVLGLVVLFLTPVLGICVSIIRNVSPVTFILSFLALSLMMVTYIPTLRFFGLGVFTAVTLPFVGTLYAAMTVSSAINYLSGRREWRGTRREN
ncbi:MAG: glycosyltransferase, partial [Candidatus Scalinduaceae bacterium]